MADVPSEDRSMSDAELGAFILGGWERLVQAEGDGPRLNRRLAARFTVSVSEIEHIRDVRNEFAHSGKASRSDLERAHRIIRSIERNQTNAADNDPPPQPQTDPEPSQPETVSGPEISPQVHQSHPDRTGHFLPRPAMTRLVMGLNASLTVVVLAIQGAWLYASWHVSTLLSAWWNFVTWGSWEMPVGQPWASMTGYFTVGCGILLLIGWAMTLNDVDPVPSLVAISTAGIAVPALLSIPVLLVIAFATFIGLFGLLIGLVTGSNAGADFWDKMGDSYLDLLGFIGYLAGTYLAIMSSYVVFWAWQRRYRSRRDELADRAS